MSSTVHSLSNVKTFVLTLKWRVVKTRQAIIAAVTRCTIVYGDAEISEQNDRR